MAYKIYDRVVWNDKECIIAYMGEDSGGHNTIVEFVSYVGGWENCYPETHLKDYKPSGANRFYWVSLKNIQQMSPSGEIFN